MAPFSHLCSELQDEVWSLATQDAVQADKPRTCLSLVCRDWQREIERLIYTELCIECDGNDVTTFSKILNHDRLHHLQKLTIALKWPFNSNDIDRKQSLRHLETTAQQIGKVFNIIKAVEEGQKPHLKLVLQVRYSFPRSPRPEVRSLWSDATFRDSGVRLRESLSVLDGWAKSLPTVAVVTGLHLQPDILPFPAMDGFIHRFPNLEDIGLEFLFRHDDEQCWWFAQEFLTHDISPASLKAPTVTITRRQDPRYEEELMGLRTAPGHLPFIQTLGDYAKSWKKFHLMDFGHITHSPNVYTELFNLPHQPDEILTSQWSHLREVRIDDVLELSDAEDLLTDKQSLHGWRRDTYALFTAAGNAAAVMPALEEMDICVHLGDDWNTVATRLHYRCKPKEIWFGAEMPRSGFRAVLDISGAESTHDEESNVAAIKAVKAATEVFWTSSVETARGLPLQVTWHDHVD